MYSLSLTANDGQLFGRDTVVVQVEPNNPPIITSTPKTEVLADQIYSDTVKAYDPDGHSVAFRLSKKPGGMDIDTSTGAINWNTDSMKVGAYEIEVVVSDSLGGQAKQSYLLTVMALDVSKVDIVPVDLDISGVIHNPATLTSSGIVSIRILNNGTDTIRDPYRICLFKDNNFNCHFETGIDQVLGSAMVLSPHPPSDTILSTINIGTIPSSGNDLFFAYADCDTAIIEFNENNNVVQQKNDCVYTPPVRSFQPKLEWKWDSSTVAPLKVQPYATPMVARLNDDNGDGKIDNGDIPDIVFVAASVDSMNNRVRNAVLRAIKGDGSGELFCNTQYELHTSAPVAIGDIDKDGLPEIVAVGEDDGKDSMSIIAFENNGDFKWKSRKFYYFSGNGMWTNSIDDLDADGSPEIIVGGNILNADGTLKAHLEGSEGFYPLSTIVDLNLDGKKEIVIRNTAYFSDGSVYWRNYDIASGFYWTGLSPLMCVPSNLDDDPYPELVFTMSGSYFSDGGYAVLEHDGKIKRLHLNHNIGGGPPLVSDFDGNGEKDIGIAWQLFFTADSINRSKAINDQYEKTELWQNRIKDQSSGWTGSTAFDFDNDGSSEIVFADEACLWIANGKTGEILFQDSVGSGTAMENPVVADVDNDGNAEIVTIANEFRSYGIDTVSHRRGICVYGDANDSWVAARSIWNERNYHVTNVEDDGTIPVHETPSWLAGYNYYQNTAIKPTGCDDIVASFVRIDGTSCQDSARVTARITNSGVHNVGKNIPVSFYYNTAPENGGVYIGTTTTTKNFRIGEYEDVSYTIRNPLPGMQTLVVVADQDSAGNGIVSESDELNNRATVTFDMCNKAPVITSAPVDTSAEGIAYIYQVEASDGDNDALMYQLPICPAGMVINGNSGLITWTPDSTQGLSHNVEVRVIDGRGGAGAQKFSLMVRDAMNDAPRFISAPVTTGSEESLYSG
jgi:hypothetical protein